LPSSSSKKTKKKSDLPSLGDEEREILTGYESEFFECHTVASPSGCDRGNYSYRYRKSVTQIDSPSNTVLNAYTSLVDYEQWPKGNGPAEFIWPNPDPDPKEDDDDGDDDNDSSAKKKKNKTWPPLENMSPYCQSQGLALLMTRNPVKESHYFQIVPEFLVEHLIDLPERTMAKGAKTSVFPEELFESWPNIHPPKAEKQRKTVTTLAELHSSSGKLAGPVNFDRTKIWIKKDVLSKYAIPKGKRYKRIPNNLWIIRNPDVLHNKVFCSVLFKDLKQKQMQVPAEVAKYSSKSETTTATTSAITTKKNPAKTKTGEEKKTTTTTTTTKEKTSKKKETEKKEAKEEKKPKKTNDGKNKGDSSKNKGKKSKSETNRATEDDEPSAKEQPQANPARGKGTKRKKDVADNKDVLVARSDDVGSGVAPDVDAGAEDGGSKSRKKTKTPAAASAGTRTNPSSVSVVSGDPAIGSDDNPRPTKKKKNEKDVDAMASEAPQHGYSEDLKDLLLEVKNIRKEQAEMMMLIKRQNQVLEQCHADVVRCNADVERCCVRTLEGTKETLGLKIELQQHFADASDGQRRIVSRLDRLSDRIPEKAPVSSELQPSTKIDDASSVVDHNSQKEDSKEKKNATQQKISERSKYPPAQALLDKAPSVTEGSDTKTVLQGSKKLVFDSEEEKEEEEEGEKEDGEKEGDVDNRDDKDDNNNNSDSENGDRDCQDDDVDENRAGGSSDSKTKNGSLPSRSTGVANDGKPETDNKSTAPSSDSKNMPALWFPAPQTQTQSQVQQQQQSKPSSHPPPMTSSKIVTTSSPPARSTPPSSQSSPSVDSPLVIPLSKNKTSPSSPSTAFRAPSSRSDITGPKTNDNRGSSNPSKADLDQLGHLRDMVRTPSSKTFQQKLLATNPNQGRR
jgi:hypothetical protein